MVWRRLELEEQSLYDVDSTVFLICPVKTFHEFCHDLSAIRELCIIGHNKDNNDLGDQCIWPEEFDDACVQRIPGLIARRDYVGGLWAETSSDGPPRLRRPRTWRATRHVHLSSGLRVRCGCGKDVRKSK